MMLNQNDLYGKLQNIITNRFAVPSEFWLTIAAIDTRIGWTRARLVNSMSTDFDVIWLIDRFTTVRATSQALVETVENLPSPFHDIRKCFVRLGIERKNGDLVWGYVYSADGGMQQTIYHVAASLEAYMKNNAPFYDKPIASSSGWHDEASLSCKEWQMVIDASMNREIVPESVLRVRNLEMRRYLIKKIGYEKLKEMIPTLKVIHKDTHNRELFEIVLPEDFTRPMGGTGNSRRMRFVKVQDASTDREFILAVSLTATKCHDAVAWTFNRTPDQYHPTYET